MFDVGRICMKVAGREAGKFCVIVDVLDSGFVIVTGPKAVTHIKRRKCNIEHLEPTPEVIKISKNASDEDVISAYKKQGIFEKLDKKPPSEKEVEAATDAERKRATLRRAAEKEAEKKAAEEKSAAELAARYKEKPEAAAHEHEGHVHEHAEKKEEHAAEHHEHKPEEKPKKARKASAKKEEHAEHHEHKEHASAEHEHAAKPKKPRAKKKAE